MDYLQKRKEVYDETEVIDQAKVEFLLQFCFLRYFPLKKEGRMKKRSGRPWRHHVGIEPITVEMDRVGPIIVLSWCGPDG